MKALKMVSFVLILNGGMKYLGSKVNKFWGDDFVCMHFIKLPHLPLDERINTFLRAQWLPTGVVHLLRGRCVPPEDCQIR